MPRCPSCYRRLAAHSVCPRDGESPRQDRQEIAPPTRPDIPGFAVAELLGMGGFGAVWRATRDADGREIALKVGRDRKRLEREAAALTQIGRPHVPQLYGSGELDEDGFYIAMERVSGQSLVSALESLADLPDLQWVRRVSMALLEALAAAHAHGLTHCDLKPDNIFLASDAPLQITLIDFGLAKGKVLDPHGRATRSGAIVGSTEYMAPEQVRGGSQLDARTDVYAFGVVLYELLTLRPPFTGDVATVEHGHTSLRPPLLRQFAAVPQPVENVVLACLAKDREKRPADAMAVLRALGKAFQRATPHNTPMVADSKSSLLVEKRQPAVLVALETDAGTYAVSEHVKERGGFIAWQRGNDYMCVFASILVEDPGRLAIEAAHSLVDDLGARAAIHLATVVLRRRRRGPPTIKGRAVDRPEAWLPQGFWDGVLMTALFAQTQPQGSTREASDHEGFFVLSTGDLDDREPTTLVGRNDIIARAEASFQACLAHATPGLLTIAGGPGVGKSRLLRELARRVGQTCPEARAVFLHVARDPARAQERAHSALSGIVPAADGSSTVVTSRPFVLLIDDLHLASNDLLHWLEYATLNHRELPLWLVVTALPRLQTVRSRWGERANRHDLVTLEPLAHESAAALAAELLLPAEYPPAAFLERMVSWTGGNPQLLDGLAAELKRRGIVRKRTYGQGWHLATAEVGQFPTAATPRQWLAARELAAMPPELAACVRVCSVLGAAFSRDEMAWVQDAVERHGGAGTPIDTDVGLSQLVSSGTLERSGPGRMRFASKAFRDAVHELLSASDRETLHRYAAEYWRSRLDDLGKTPVEAAGDDYDMCEAFARHAAASGQSDEAAECYLALGDRARAKHDEVSAEEHYSAALRLADESAAALRARALAGRGTVLYQRQRTDEAYDDLGAARRLYRANDDWRGEVDTLLEEATAADLAADYARAAERAAEAQLRVGTIEDSMVEARLLLARGRAACREGEIKLTVELLRESCAKAEAASDNETLTIALALLAPVLVYEGELEQAERAFDRAVELSMRTGNRLQLCSVHCNRMVLWSAQRLPERAMDDLRQAIRIARQLGNPEPEHVATHNLAELLYWSGDLDEALVQARRARELQLRFCKGLPFDALLLARLHSARMELEQAASLLAALERECDPGEFDPSIRLLYRTMRLVSSGLAGEAPPGEQWAELIAESENRLPGEELVEVLWWRARVAIAHAEWDNSRNILSKIEPRLEEVPIWRYRVDVLKSYIKSEISP